MRTMVISGCDTGDEVFTTDKAIFGVEITWNKTRMVRDAYWNKFGAPEVESMSIFPPFTDAHRENIDWRKVDGIIAAGPAVVDRAVVSVMTVIEGVTHRIIVDGNNIVTARLKLGLPTFRRYSCPVDLERGYRVTFNEVADY